MISTICKYHTYKFGDGFKKQFTKCCNLFGNHVKNVKGGHLVTYEIAYQLKSKGVHVVPGWQLCHSCYDKLKIMILVVLNALMIMACCK